MTTSQQSNVNRIIREYTQGHKLAHDAVAEIAEQLRAETIDDVFRELPDALQTRFCELADMCDSDEWVNVGSNNFQTSRSPVNSQTIKLLSFWRKNRINHD
jgi:hypothetical protein